MYEIYTTITHHTLYICIVCE